VAGGGCGVPAGRSGDDGGVLLRRETTADVGFVPASSLGVEAPDPAWGEHFQARPLGTYRGERGTFAYAAPFAAL
jgi:hypothetical protein